MNFENSKLVYDQFKIIPLMYSSLEFEYIANKMIGEAHV